MLIHSFNIVSYVRFQSNAIYWLAKEAATGSAPSIARFKKEIPPLPRMRQLIIHRLFGCRVETARRCHSHWGGVAISKNRIPHPPIDINKEIKINLTGSDSIAIRLRSSVAGLGAALPFRREMRTSSSAPIPNLGGNLNAASGYQPQIKGNFFFYDSNQTFPAVANQQNSWWRAKEAAIASLRPASVFCFVHCTLSFTDFISRCRTTSYQLSLLKLTSFMDRTVYSLHTHTP